MSDTVIRVENVGKLYRIGLKDKAPKTLLKTVTGLVGTPFKYLRSVLREPAPEEVIWSLKDISFEVKQGEVLGIIGRNGAGKSTLLKILSQITEPSCGYAEIRGRVGSLLEVGTGFHPDLTGRENTYLNGTIMGMKKREIARRFDEIVAFAEVEKFIDTPVKFYSSGMYTRLAFAVAAHLEPEILIMDEVLAVGDVQFQKKCLGKMGDVATQEGRTVLFVSHNMQAVSQLTQRCVMLSGGTKQFDGLTDKAIMTYLLGQRKDKDSEQPAYYEAHSHKSGNYLAWARVHTSDQQGFHRWGKPITFEFAFNITDPQESICFSFQVLNAQQQPITHHWFFESETSFGRQAGEVILKCMVPKFRLYMGTYNLTTWLSERRGGVVTESLLSICSFEVTMEGTARQQYDWQPNVCTYIEDSVWNKY